MPSGKNSPITKAEKRRILDLHAEGKSRNEIAREVGRSTATITRTVTEAGGTFDRSNTEAATKAAIADRKVRRNAIIDRLYTRTEKALERLEAEEFRALVPVAPGRQEAQDLDFVPGAEERQISSSMTSYLTAAANLEKVDADYGVEASKHMLGSLMEQIGLHDD